MQRSSTLAFSTLLSTSLLAQAGTLDPSFANAGIQQLAPGTLHDVAYDVIALPDTTSLICGTARINGTNAMFVAHLLQNGSLDSGFGTNSGYTFFNYGEEAYAYAMGLGLDGSIYLAGLAYPTFAQSTVILAHTDANGIPDMPFGTDGVVSTPVGTLDAEAKGLVIQPDGRIVLGGSVVNAGNFARDILFLRYNPDGSLDNTFSGDGIQIADAYASEDLLNDIALLEDGSIVGAGYADIIGDMKTVLARVDANGEFVTGFGGDGVIIPGFSVTQDRAFGMMSAGQRFLVTGSFMDVPGNDDIYVASFNDDGTLDQTFGQQGVSITDVDANEVGLDLAKGTDGSIIACGTTGQAGFGVPRDFIVMRFSAEGAPDSGFGTGGYVVTSIDVDFDDANAVAVQPDGKILAAGFPAGFSDFTDNDVAVVRYLADGPSSVTVHAGNAGDLTVYPNPASSGYVWLKSTALRAGTIIDVLDAAGRVVFRSAMTGVANGIPVDGLDAGRYQVRITNARGDVATAALVIVR